MRKFGRGHSKDRRDHKLTGGKSSRKYRYWIDHQHTLDQGNTAHCVGYAWSHWLIAAPVINYVNPDGLYYFAKYVDEWKGEDYDGTSVRAGAKVLHHLGQVSSYEFTTKLDVLIYTLLEEGPVVAGMNWYRGMMKTDHEGFIYPDGEYLGGHAIVLTGINVTEGYIRGKNSWGLTYGIKGRFKLTFEAMQHLLKEEGEVCIAREMV